MNDCKASMDDKLILSISMETMGERIHAAMKAKGYSLRTLGKRIGRSHGAIRNWITGSRVEDSDLERLGRAVGKSVKYLRYGDEDPVPQINQTLLTEIIVSLEVVMTDIGAELSPEKRSEVISTLYTLSASTGTVDPRTVSSIVRLAT